MGCTECRILARRELSFLSSIKKPSVGARDVARDSWKNDSAFVWIIQDNAEAANWEQMMAGQSQFHPLDGE